MQQVLLTVDLGFGDAGKGSIVDFLTRAYAAHTVVRYNGGAQAGHRVVTAGLAPQEHIFAQFGSGTLAGAATHLSRFMLLDPLAMVEEEKHLRMLGVIDAFQRTTIDAQAVVITPFQRAINRLKELARGDQRHGSCGMGIGETVADQLEHGERVVLAGDLAKPDVLRSKLSFLRSINLAKVPITLPDNEQVAQEMDVFADAGWVDWLVARYGDLARQMQIVPGDFLNSLLRKPGSVVFEGAQGVLLDEWLGFHPYTTWSTTTLQNADRLLREAGYRGRVARIGLTRGYATRHGPGPFVSEDAALTGALPDPSNRFWRLAARFSRGLARSGAAPLRLGSRRSVGLPGRDVLGSLGGVGGAEDLLRLSKRQRQDRTPGPLVDSAGTGLPGEADPHPGALPPVVRAGV